MSDQDPAVSGWQAATEAHLAASTSAIGRDLQSQLDRLRKDYNAVLLERTAAERERDEALRRAADLEQVREELSESRKLVEAVACVKEIVEGQRDELVNRSSEQKAEIERLNAPLTKLSFNAIPAAMEALENVAVRTGDSRTDTANRALQAYEALLSLGIGEYFVMDGRKFVRFPDA